MADTGSISARSFSSVLSVVVVAALFGLIASAVLAQDQGPGPIPPPPDHHVVRIEGVGEAPAPPSLPPMEIIQAFTKKEDTYLATRPQFSYRKTIHIQEFGPDGHPSGEYLATYDAARTPDGKLYEKAVRAPQSSLQYLSFEPEDAQRLTRLPEFPVTSGQLSKYDVKYLNTEKVDEIDCYIFQVSPKTLEREHALFDGVIWVDQKYLEVVKTYGRWITDLGAVHPPSLPFDIFETYRDNVEGKYWFPDYARADGTYKMKDRDIPIRVTIKWTDFKPFPVVAAPGAASSTPGAPQATPTPTASSPAAAKP
jgi:hypothetical protein